jgi:hypothetical protein
MVMISLVTLAAYVWNSLRIEPTVKEIGEKEQLWYECFHMNQMLKGINDNRYVNTTEMDYVQCDQRPDNVKLIFILAQRMHTTKTVSKNNVVPDDIAFESPR